MSYNLRADVELLDPVHEPNLFSLYLNRTQAGFTGTANLQIGHYLKFDDVVLRVDQIEHIHQAPHGSVAPTSVVACNGSITMEQLETLKRHGFQ